MFENVVGKMLYKMERKICYYYYYNIIIVYEEFCREMLFVLVKDNVIFYKKFLYVYDDKMKKLVNMVKEFEEKKFGMEVVKNFL